MGGELPLDTADVLEAYPPHVVDGGRQPEGTALAVTAVMALSAALGAAGTAVTIVLATRVYHTVLAALREQLVGRAMTLPQHLVERAGTGDLTSRSSDDVTAVADAAPAVIPVLTVTVFTIVVSLGGLAALEWPYAAAFAVVLPVYALARLLLADPELAILDEATAEAGSTHADLLDRAAEAALAGRTGLVIAHRLSQAAECDRIVVMDRGRIVETGTHDELVEAGGVYAVLWEAWLKGQALGETKGSG